MKITSAKTAKTPESQKLAAWCFALSTVATGVFYYFWPYATIRGYLIVWLLVAGALYQPALQMTAQRKIVDSDR
jgi:hypothetical protein